MSKPGGAGGLSGVRKVRYTDAENRAIVQFLIENQNSFGSFGIFVQAAEQEVFKENNRTAQSLYQRFHKYIAAPWKTNASKLSNQQLLSLAERYKVKLTLPVIKNLKEYFNIEHDEGLIKEFQITSEGLAVELNQLTLDRGAEVKNPDEAGEENPDGGKKEDLDKGGPIGSKEASNALFEILALLIGSLNSEDEDFDRINDHFGSLITAYWHEEIQPMKRVNQGHLSMTVQAFLGNFTPLQENEKTVVLNGETLRHLETVYRSLEEPHFTEQALLDAISTASRGQIKRWNSGNEVYPDFTFPSNRIKRIIGAVFAALQPEGFDA